MFVLCEFECVCVCRGGCRGMEDHVAFTPHDPARRPPHSQLQQLMCGLRWEGSVFEKETRGFDFSTFAVLSNHKKRDSID